MLFYKAWVESRTRFLLGACAMASLTAVFVLFNHDVRTIVTDQEVSYGEYIWRSIFKGQLRDIFVILTLLLGLGGLERERAYGTAGHTLALPVSRWTMILARAITGISETTVLAFLPASMVPILSPFIHESYSWRLALQFAALWAVGGILIFAMASSHPCCLLANTPLPLLPLFFYLHTQSQRICQAWNNMLLISTIS